MTREVFAFLAPEHGGVFVDCTIGLGGHARAVLESGATRVIGLDSDSAALAVAARNLEAWRDRVELVHADYRAIASALDPLGIDRVDGTVADLGISSLKRDAQVSGAVHLSESRARRAGSVFGGSREPAANRGTHGRDYVPFARRSHREAHDARAGRARAHGHSRVDEKTGCPPAGRDRTKS